MQIDNFSRPWWLFSSDVETIYSSWTKEPKVSYQNKIIPTLDNDKISLDYIRGYYSNPLIVLFHGLEGCSQSRTLRQLAVGFAQLGWTVAVPHFRSCGGLSNTLPRAYHAVDVKEIKWMLHYCQTTFEHTALFAVGVSLGASALVHSLVQDRSPFPVAAATVSMPFDLAACVRCIDGGKNRYLYGHHFLKSLRQKVIAKTKLYPGIGSARKINKIRTFKEFDEIYTARVHGFASASDYWQQASTTDVLDKVKIPLFCINAQNDPLIPKRTLPQQSTNENVVFCRPLHGGHGGFYGTPKDWLFEQIKRFFKNNANV